MAGRDPALERGLMSSCCRFGISNSPQPQERGSGPSPWVYLGCSAAPCACKPRLGALSQTAGCRCCCFPASQSEAGTSPHPMKVPRETDPVVDHQVFDEVLLGHGAVAVGPGALKGASISVAVQHPATSNSHLALAPDNLSGVLFRVRHQRRQAPTIHLAHGAPKRPARQHWL